MKYSLYFLLILLFYTPAGAQPVGTDFVATCGSYMSQTDGYDKTYRPIPSTSDTVCITASIGHPYLTTSVYQTGLSAYKTTSKWVLGGFLYQDGYSVSKRTALGLSYGRRLASAIDAGVSAAVSRRQVRGESHAPFTPSVRVCVNMAASDKTNYGVCLRYSRVRPEAQVNGRFYWTRTTSNNVSFWVEVLMDHSFGLRPLCGIRKSFKQWQVMAGLNALERQVGFGFVYVLSGGKLHVSWRHDALLGFKSCIAWTWVV